MHLILVRIKKHYSIKRCVLKLGPALAQGFGGSKFYTVPQVEKTLQKLESPVFFPEYAFALYCTKQNFIDYCSKQGWNCNYETLKQEIVKKNFEIPGSENHDFNDHNDTKYFFPG